MGLGRAPISKEWHPDAAAQNDAGVSLAEAEASMEEVSARFSAGASGDRENSG